MRLLPLAGRGLKLRFPPGFFVAPGCSDEPGSGRGLNPAQAGAAVEHLSSWNLTTVADATQLLNYCKALNVWLPMKTVWKLPSFQMWWPTWSFWVWVCQTYAPLATVAADLFPGKEWILTFKALHGLQLKNCPLPYGTRCPLRSRQWQEGTLLFGSTRMMELFSNWLQTESSWLQPSGKALKYFYDPQLLCPLHLQLYIIALIMKINYFYCYIFIYLVLYFHCILLWLAAMCLLLYNKYCT